MLRLGDRDLGALPGGLLCVDNAQYRVEDSSVASQLKPVAGAPVTSGRMFGPDGCGLTGQPAGTMLEKR